MNILNKATTDVSEKGLVRLVAVVDEVSEFTDTLLCDVNEILTNVFGADASSTRIVPADEKHGMQPVSGVIPQLIETLHSTRGQLGDIKAKLSKF